MPRAAASLLAAVSLTLGLVQAAPAQTLPSSTGVVAFFGGPTTFPHTGSMTTSTCIADASPCAVSLSTTSSTGALDASGTGTATDGTQTVSFQWVSNPHETGPFALVPGDEILGAGTDQNGVLYNILGTLAGGPTGGTTGNLQLSPQAICDTRLHDPVCDAFNGTFVALRQELDASGVITSYTTKGSSFAGNGFSTSSAACSSGCTLYMYGTGSVPGTTTDPATYTATGTGTLNNGAQTINFTFQLTTALCLPDVTCGSLTGSGQDSAGDTLKLAGNVRVDGFGQGNPFPNLSGSLAYVRVPPAT